MVTGVVRVDAWLLVLSGWMRGTGVVRVDVLSGWMRAYWCCQGGCVVTGVVRVDAWYWCCKGGCVVTGVVKTFAGAETLLVLLAKKSIGPRKHSYTINDSEAKPRAAHNNR